MWRVCLDHPRPSIGCSIKRDAIFLVVIPRACVAKGEHRIDRCKFLLAGVAMFLMHSFWAHLSQAQRPSVAKIFLGCAYRFALALKIAAHARPRTVTETAVRRKYDWTPWEVLRIPCKRPSAPGRPFGICSTMCGGSHTASDMTRRSMLSVRNIRAVSSRCPTVATIADSYSCQSGRNSSRPLRWYCPRV